MATSPLIINNNYQKQVSSGLTQKYRSKINSACFVKKSNILCKFVSINVKKTNHIFKGIFQRNIYLQDISCSMPIYQTFKFNKIFDMNSFKWYYIIKDRNKFDM